MVASELGATISNVSRLGASADLIARAVENRAALAALELAEARQRLTTVLLWVVVAAFALLLAGVTFNLIVAAIFWDTPQRVTSLVVLAVLQLAVVGLGAWYIRTRWQRCSVFEDSRTQLRKDLACLREIFTQSQS